MKLACATMAYKEERFIKPFLEVMLPRVDEVLVLNTTKPWLGEDDGTTDNTGDIANSMGATVIQHPWDTEHEQRNAGQQYLSSYDWIITLDPDEFILDDAWARLVNFLDTTNQQPGLLPAYVCGMQHTYWKRGYVIDPPEDYKQIIATRPHVEYFDKRCVDSPWGYAPIDLHHFSWARTDDEVWKKITTYAHANEFSSLDWFGRIWKSGKTEDLHPLTPESLKKAVPVVLPEELERLGLWPGAGG